MVRAFGRRPARGHLLVAIGLLVGGCADDPDQGVDAGGQQTSAQVALGPESGQTLAPRFSAAVTSTAHGIFVFGGSPERDQEEGFLSDGGLVSNDLSTTEALPASPFEAGLRFVSAVSAGDSVVVAGVECDVRPESDPGRPICDPGSLAVATFDLTERTWQRLPLPDELASIDQSPGEGNEYVGAYAKLGGVTSTGQVVAELGQAKGDFWLIDPESGEFVHLGIPPLAATPDSEELTRAEGFSGALRGACIAGDTVIAIESSNPTPGNISGSYVIQGLKVHLLDAAGDRTWRDGDQLDHAFRVDAELRCLGPHAFVTDGPDLKHGVFLLDPATGAWRTPSADPNERVAYDLHVWTGEEILFYHRNDLEAPGVAYNAATDSWRTLRPVPVVMRQLVFVDGQVVGLVLDTTASATAGQLGAFIPEAA